jgi:alpha-D-xyloside xylohydrolase
MTAFKRLGSCILVLVSSLLPSARAEFVSDATGVTVQTAGGLTRVEIWGDRTARVIHAPNSTMPTLSSLAVNSSPVATVWQVQDNGANIVLTTPGFSVNVDTASGKVTFLDPSSAIVLAESNGGTTFQATTIGSPAEASLVVKQKFDLPAGESIYGLGQQQGGVMNWVGQSVTLQQKNAYVAVPVSLSNKGYALLWDNPAVTTVDVGAATSGQLSWSSEAGDAVDYYFCFGPEPDQAIAGYRKLTGAAPMFGKWAWGFWQSKERYSTQQELIDVVAQYRSLEIPIDGIIQDWQYWPALNQTTATGGWGSHQFDPARFPDPTGMMDSLHGQNVHALISVWAKFDVTNNGVSIPNLQELEAVNAAFNPAIPYVYPAGQGKWYDPYSSSGRQVYWNQLSQKIFSKGLDGWWLDASEAEFSGDWGEFRNFTTAQGAGAKVYNAYPLMHTSAVYEGQRAENSAKRAIILTRSAYAGQQRNASITWSGDIQGNWETYIKQIPAGLNFTASGIPYWNTDIGGFFGGNPATAAYAELFTRWFQYGSFTPMFRVHGTNYAKEVWRFPTATQPILKDYINLRYRLMPYIYSTAWKVTNEGYTMMRPLVMDFRNDAQAQGIGNQFMFGPSLLVNPVTTAGATSRNVYLPSGTRWFDFWTGASMAGGQTISTDAPIGKIPLFVRAGSIIPNGPPIQYATENVDPTELRVYQGSDGSFTLYEDEGDNYNYESGARSTIQLDWDDAGKVLKIGQRQGSFSGMLSERTFRVVFVSPQHGIGLVTDTPADVVVSYNGDEVLVPRPPQPDPPAAPTGVSANAVSNGISVTWQASVGGVYYNLQRSLQNGGPYVSVSSAQVGTSFVDTSIVPGSTYYYVVSAINAGGEGAVSSMASATFGAAAIQSRLMFNEASGTAAADASGHGNHGALLNGAAFVATGKGGNAVNLDGTDDHVSLPQGVVAEINNFTISTWVNLSNVSSNSRIFDFGTGTTNYLFLTPKNGQDVVSFAISNSGGAGEQSITGNAALPSGNWTHVAVTLVGNVGILYVNGQEVGRNEAMTINPSSLGTTTQNWIGRSQFAADPYLSGRVDDFRIYSGALNAAEIAGLYSGSAGALLSPWSSQDIGAPTLAGSSGSGDAGVASMLLTASGSDIQNAADQCHFSSQSWTGDGSMIVRLASLENSNSWAKAGLMIRESMAAGSRNCMIALTPENGCTFQYRGTTGGTTSYAPNPAQPGIVAPQWLKLVRWGNSFTPYRSADGVSWVKVANAVTLSIPSTAYFGMVLTSHNNSGFAATEFSNASISPPPPPSPLTGSASQPSTDADDAYYLPTAINDADNIGGSGISTSAGNDEDTYVAADRSSKGQTFTTGSNPAGYDLQSFTIQHVQWPTYLTNGTYYNLQPGDRFEVQIGTLSGTTKSPVYIGSAVYSGSALANPTSPNNKGSGTYFTFDLSSAEMPTLAPNTVCYFEIAADAGDPYFELNGSRTGTYAGGTAFRGNTGADLGLIGTGVNVLAGDRAFHVDLAKVTAPGFSSWISGYPAVGDQSGFNEDADGDGLKNGLENVFGTNPGVSNEGVKQIGFNGTVMTFQHPQNALVAGDIDVSYRWTTDLVNFHESGATTDGCTAVLSAAENDPVQGTTTVSAVLSGNVPSKFMVVVRASQAP